MDAINSSFKDISYVLSNVGAIFSATWFFIMPPLLYWAFKALWLDQIVDRTYLASVKKILLEIKFPQNIEKSPKVMESFFSGLHGVLTTIPVNEFYLKGRVIEYFSLEIVGDSGEIHFYIKCPVWDRGIVESNLYAQYPDAQITEAEDYVDKVSLIMPNKHWEIWGADAKLTDSDPMPIRTYNKFQEDITGKMIDPLSSVLEVMGRLGPNQKIWFQILINPVKEGWEHEEGQKIIDKLAKGKRPSAGILESIVSDIKDVFTNLFPGVFGPVEFAGKKEEKEQAPLEFRLTPGEKERLKALEENMTKNQFKTKVRFVYVGRRENYDKPGVVGGFWGAMKQFSDQYSNGFTIHDPTKTYAWYFMTKSRLRYRQRILFQRYIHRDPSGHKFILSTSELATLFHAPDMSAMAPAIPRVEAKLGGAPANLPVE